MPFPFPHILMKREPYDTEAVCDSYAWKSEVEKITDVCFDAMEQANN